MPQHFTHERFTREEQAAPGSERSYAIVMALALVVIGSINFWHNGHIWPWLGVILVHHGGVYGRRPGPAASCRLVYSARVQTVHANTDPLFHRLIMRFKEKTGCPMLVDTSFNVRGEPIVCTPEDAFRCFMGNELDLLVIGNCCLRKDVQDSNLKRDYRPSFELD
jgi:hypothetical protein